MEGFLTPPIDWNQAQTLFQKNGYVVLKGFNEEAYYRNLEATYLSFLNKYKPEFFSEFGLDGLMENQAFHDRVIQLRQETPGLFSAIYDSLMSSVSLLNLALSPQIIEALSLLSQQPKESLVCFNQVLRMDAPFDTRNISGWHQDTFNDEAYHDYQAGITAWMPLHSVSQENGSLQICHASHKERVERIAVPQEGSYASLYYTIPEVIRNRYSQFHITMNRGDLLLLSMNLIHASGTNSSSKVRFTVQTRYYPFGEANFVPGSRIYRSTKNIPVPWNVAA